MSMHSATAPKRAKLTVSRPVRRLTEETARISHRGIALRLFLTCWMLYVLHFATNTVREIYPALSLGDHLSFDVSEYVGFHPDIFEIPGRGAFINNNPGASIVGAVPYLLTRPIIDRLVERQQRMRAPTADEAPRDYDTIYPMAREFYRKARERGLDVKFGAAAAVMQSMAMAPLSALSVVVMYYLLVSVTASVRAATALALLYGVATPIFYRTAQLNQNLMVAYCALFAFALLWRPWDAPSDARRPQYFWAGLLCGWAVVCDYSGLVVVAVLGGYALARWRALPVSMRSGADLGRFAGGVVLCGGILLAYQWACFGNPLFPAQRYMPPANYTDLGFVGMDRPHWDLLWETAFGMRFGLFMSAPVLLLALYPPAWTGRMRLVGAREVRCIAWFCALFFLFCSANQYGRMQFNSGVRHIVPVSPFLFLIASGVLLRIPLVGAWCIGLTTAYWSWCLAMYRDVEQGLGVFESLIHITLEGFRLPWLKTLEAMGYVGSGTTAVPLLAIFAAIVWALWAVGTPLPRAEARHRAAARTSDQ